MISIKVKIAERYYPLTIEAGNEVYVRSAAKMINEKINNYMQTFTTADKQDALAMCAIEVASDLSSLQNQHQLAEAAILQEINQISQVLTA